MKDENIDAIVIYYCGDGMRRLRQICDPMIAKFGSLSKVDYDDFYSIANETVWTAAKQFDDDIHDCFDIFLRCCLSKKFKTEMTRRNRQKRIPTGKIGSIDGTVSQDSDRPLAEVLDSGYRIENEIEELRESDCIKVFISGLSKKQIKIVGLIIQGYDKETIKKILGISDKRYDICINGMKTLNNRLLLTGKFID